MKDTKISYNCLNNTKMLFYRIIYNLTILIEDQNIKWYKSDTNLQAINPENKKIKDRDINFDNF